MFINASIHKLLTSPVADPMHACDFSSDAGDCASGRIENFWGNIVRNWVPVSKWTLSEATSVHGKVTGCWWPLLKPETSISDGRPWWKQRQEQSLLLLAGSTVDEGRKGEMNVVVGSAEDNFLDFVRRFWNHTLTWKYYDVL